MKVLNPLKEAELREIISDINAILSVFPYLPPTNILLQDKLNRFRKKYDEKRNFIVTSISKDKHIVEFK